MSLTREQVLHLVKLSRLQLTEAEQETFPGQLSSILEYVGQLQGVKTRPEANFRNAARGNVIREDTAVIRAHSETAQLIKAAPFHQGDVLKTKAVFS